MLCLKLATFVDQTDALRRTTARRQTITARRQLLNFFLAEQANRGHVVGQGLVDLSVVILRRTAMNEGLHANVGAAEDWSLAPEFDGKPRAGVSPPGISSAS